MTNPDDDFACCADGPKPVEDRARDAHQDEMNDGGEHGEAIIYALRGLRAEGYDDEHMGRAVRALLEIEEV